MWVSGTGVVTCKNKTLVVVDISAECVGTNESALTNSNLKVTGTAEISNKIDASQILKSGGYKSKEDQNTPVVLTFKMDNMPVSNLPSISTAFTTNMWQAVR